MYDLKYTRDMFDKCENLNEFVCECKERINSTKYGTVKPSNK